MITKRDPRHQKRIQTVKSLFAFSFNEKNKTSPEISDIISHSTELDALIVKGAPLWPIDKIAKIDLAILRLSLYELTVVKQEPPKVIIDEAVEIAKEYGNDTSPQFINGVLGTIYSWINNNS